MPDILYTKPVAGLDKDKSADLLLASISIEELGLANIINTEAEVVGSVLDTSGNDGQGSPTADNLIKISKSAEHVIREIIKKEMLLEFELNNLVNQLSTTTTTTSSTTSTSTSTSSTTSSTSTSTTTSSTSSSTTTSTKSTTTTTTKKNQNQQ